MVYQELEPDPRLRSSVACYWNFRLEPHDPSPLSHTIPPDGTVSIAWISPPGLAVLVGPRVEALRTEVQAGAIYAGVRLMPGAAASLLGLDIPKLRDVKLPLSAVADAAAFESAMRNCTGAANLEVVAASLSPVLLDWVTHPAKPPDPLVDRLISRMLAGETDASIEHLTAGLGVGYRQVLRRFHGATGLTPKEFARLRRIRQACIHALSDSSGGVAPAWAGISADAGFADQSHLSREFGRTFGWPPKLVHEYLRRIEHRGVKA